MKFNSDRQRKAVMAKLSGFSRCPNRFSDVFGNEWTPTVGELMAGKSGFYPQIPMPTEFSFGMSSVVGDAGVFGDDLDEYSKKSPQPGLLPGNKCQLVMPTYIKEDEYDADEIPKEALDNLGITRKEAEELYKSHGIKITLGKKRFSIVPGDRVLNLGNKDIDYGPNFGVVKEVKDKSILIKFDDSGKEIWYPEEMVYTQRMLDDSIKDKLV